MKDDMRSSISASLIINNSGMKEHAKLLMSTWKKRPLCLKTPVRAVRGMNPRAWRRERPPWGQSKPNMYMAPCKSHENEAPKDMGMLQSLANIIFVWPPLVCRFRLFPLSPPMFRSIALIYPWKGYEHCHEWKFWYIDIATCFTVG